MYRIFALSFVAFVVSALAEDVRITTARQAMKEGLPQVAIHELATQPWHSPEERDEADLILSEALLGAGRPAEALPLLQRFSETDAQAQFWLAQTLVALGNKPGALAIYERLAGEKDFPRQIEALVGQARMLNALGQAQKAISLLASVPAPSNGIALELAEMRLDAGDAKGAAAALTELKNPDQREVQTVAYLGGRIALALGNIEEARHLLQSVTRPAAHIAGARIVALSECDLRQNKAADAEKNLEDFIDGNPRYIHLDQVFTGLDRVYSAQGASSSTELRRWSENASEPGRAAVALYYLARNEARLSKVENSQQDYREFLTRYPQHILAEEARVALASSLMAASDAKGALTVLESGTGSQLHFLRGLALAKSSQYTDASAEFLKVVPADFDAIYNAAVCQMLSGVPDEKNTAISELKATSGGNRLLEKYEFINAMYQASKRQPVATGLLRRIAGSGSRYANRAQLALAEFEGVELNTKAAGDDLQKVSLKDADAKERAKCLEIFLADTGEPESEAQVVSLAGAFLKAYPKSAFEPEVRMKIGEMLFRKGDYLGSRDQFDIIAHSFPESPLAEKATFLAAQAVSRSMNPNAMEEAIEIYEQVVKRGGPMALRARFAQALLQTALNRPQEAIGILDSVLESKIDPEMRFMTLTEKGDTYFSQGEKDKENYHHAIETWQQIADTPNVTKQWRNQALAKMGTANEKLGNNDAALACYYQVLSADQKNEPEYFWFYKAGFNAGKLLESEKLWKEAIAIYEKIAAVEGPRAEEAKGRANQIRLENFLWEN